MDFQQYKQGAIALAALAILITVIDQFGSPEKADKDPIVSVKSFYEVPVDETPACVAENVDPAPPVFASAPNPHGIATRQVFDRLVEYDRRSGKIVPGLATRWEVSDSGLFYTFYLRKHVNFNAVEGYTPTRAFNANDVLFTFGRLMSETNPYYAPDTPASKDFRTVAMDTLISGITRREPHVVEFELSVPYTKFLSNLTMDFASIQSQEYADTMEKAGTEKAFFSTPVGTGAFTIAHREGDTVLYRANPTYWGNFLPKAGETKLEQQLPSPEITGVD